MTISSTNGICSHSKKPLFNKILIANRGEIAIRIAKTLKKLGIVSVVIYSEADQNHKHVRVADIAVKVDAKTPADAYLNIEEIIRISKELKVDAIIPGYGFLAENADFAQACEENGIIFVGPTPQQMKDFGLKHVAKELAQKLDIPLNNGTDLLENVESACKAAKKIGYPVMLKCTGGGGGIGLSKCNNEPELRSTYESVQRLGLSFFSNSHVFLEKFVENARHIEVQIFGDGNGNVIALGERDCSIQRRNQKIIEETPAPNLPEKIRQGILDASEKLAGSVNYRSAGTVEFLYDEKDEKFYFIEVNARLQVEHCVTEEVLGIDLVEWMIRTAAKSPPNLKQKLYPKGASIEVRIYAEEPLRHFLPSIGTLTEVQFPENIRVDGYVELGTEVLPSFDPLLAKVIVHGQDRRQAVELLKDALIKTRISGVSTNIEYLLAILDDERYKKGKISTQLLANFTFHAPVIEVLEPGTFTTIQDYPGRVGYWDIGLPPSGPMDDWAFRMANRILENPESSAAIEATIIGPTLRFHTDTYISLTGAPTDATLDGKRVLFWKPIHVQAGQTLRVGKIISGCRTYLGVRNGFNVPEYLGSKSTFTPGQFGGHAGRALRGSDMLLINRENGHYEPINVPGTLVPIYGEEWDIGCLLGPHGAPDFITAKSFESFFKTPFEVHYNSNRLGIRLECPKPEWVRSDGGEAGLHPSNIHDCEYAIGSVNFTGDMPVILTCDGPSLGGFVCPMTIVKAELWKVGQLKPGDKIWFKPMNFDDALELEKFQDKTLKNLSPTPRNKLFENFGKGADKNSIILYQQEEKNDMPKIVYRQAGDKYILIEYGENILDLNLRCRVHEMMEELKQHPIQGILELSPGVRSLQIHYDSRIIHQHKLLQVLVKIEQELPDSTKMKIKSRVLYLPMSFEDPATLDAISRYRKSVRDTAPWLPSNIEFMRRINGLESTEDVRRTIFETSYMVLGLGDVYLGAPCAVPVDPRHRLLTSKYNPARTFTAEGTVGIGGVYMCIYGMDSPGGYQLVGRTLPIWNKFITNKQCFEEGAPWLLRFFDQCRFYEVEANELEVMREDFRYGRFKIRVEEEVFDFEEYNRFLKEHEEDISEFKVKQKKAFDEEVKLWADMANNIDTFDDESDDCLSHHKFTNGRTVSAEFSGNVWQISVKEGDRVKSGDTLLVLEAMKMEFRVISPCDGVVGSLRCRIGVLVRNGDPLVMIEQDEVCA